MCCVENPMVRDELWTSHRTNSDDGGYDDEESILANALASEARCKSGNCKGCIWYKQDFRHCWKK